MGELIQYRVGKQWARWGTLLQEDYENVGKVLKEEGLIQSVPPYQDFYKPALTAEEACP